MWLKILNKFTHRPMRLVGLTWLGILATACAPSQLVQPDCDGDRIIVQIAPDITQSPAELAVQFSVETGIPMSYMRPLQERFHLYCMGHSGKQASVVSVTRRLAARADVISAVPDRVYAIQEHR